MYGFGELEERNKRLEEALRLEKEKCSKLEERCKQLEDLVFIDYLTKLYNQRGFYVLLNSESSKIGKENDKREDMGYRFTLLKFDIDYFKMINDNYGHDAGDTVLMEIGSIIRKRLRCSDTSGRIGGDEFSIIFPFIDCSRALKPADDLRKLVESYDFEVTDLEGKKRTVKTTISAGLAYVGTILEFEPYREEGIEKSILKAADAALYAAKEKKNKVCIYAADGSSAYDFGNA